MKAIIALWWSRAWHKHKEHSFYERDIAGGRCWASYCKCGKLLELRRLDEYTPGPSLRDAALEVIELNRQRAADQYGDPEKAESWQCVKLLRAALL